MKILLLLSLFLLVHCATAPKDNILERSYFEREGANVYATSSENRPESYEDLDSISETTKSVQGGIQVAGLKDNPNSQCACDDIKVCPGKPVPKPFGGNLLAETPRINAPKVQQGHNRFYFLRSCDQSPEDLAFFIYGDRQRASELLASVGGVQNWKAGRVVSYRSPKKPTDPNISNFYTDHPPIAKKYLVQGGDTLASIAYKVYGDSRNWKELALENNLSSPDQLRQGQVLSLFYKE